MCLLLTDLKTIREQADPNFGNTLQWTRCNVLATSVKPVSRTAQHADVTETVNTVQI